MNNVIQQIVNLLYKKITKKRIYRQTSNRVLTSKYSNTRLDSNRWDTGIYRSLRNKKRVITSS